jgi:hypothetical protein
MKTRLERMSGNELTCSIQTDRANLTGIKQPQRIGPKSLVTQITEAPHVSGQVYCLSFSQSAVHSFSLTFTATNQSYPLSSIYVRFFTDAACTSELHPDFSAGSLWPAPVITKVPPSSSTPLAATWNVTNIGGLYGASGSYYVRAYVQSVDSGSITVVQTS